MLPPGPMDWAGPEEVTGAFSSWFGSADDFELIDCASGERYTGPEGARRNAEGWLIPFADAKVELLKIPG